MSPRTLDHGAAPTRKRAPKKKPTSNEKPGKQRDHVSLGAGVDPRIQARRREVELDAGRRRRSRVIAFFVVVAAVAAVVALVQSPLLDVDRFDVRATDHVSADALIEVSGVKLHQPLALVDAEAVRARILLLPWVEDATVVARWPATLRLAVTERVPVAVATTAGGMALIDADGRVLGPAVSPPAPDSSGPALVEGLVIPEPGNLIDARGQAALETLAALPAGARSRLEAIVVGVDGDMSLRLRPDMVAMVGPVTDLDEKMQTLETMLAQVVLDDVEVIDLRVAGTGYITRRTPEAETTSSATTGSAATTSGSGSPSPPD